LLQVTKPRASAIFNAASIADRGGGPRLMYPPHGWQDNFCSAAGCADRGSPAGYYYERNAGRNP
jgi:hypothetical protein